MAYINLDDDFVTAEDLQLLKTKQAILDKLRLRFGEFGSQDGWTAPRRADEAESPGRRANHPR